MSPEGKSSGLLPSFKTLQLISTLQKACKVRVVGQLHTKPQWLYNSKFTGKQSWQNCIRFGYSNQVVCMMPLRNVITWRYQETGWEWGSLYQHTGRHRVFHRNVKFSVHLKTAASLETRQGIGKQFSSSLTRWKTRNVYKQKLFIHTVSHILFHAFTSQTGQLPTGSKQRKVLILFVTHSYFLTVNMATKLQNTQKQLPKKYHELTTLALILLKSLLGHTKTKLQGNTLNALLGLRCMEFEVTCQGWKAGHIRPPTLLFKTAYGLFCSTSTGYDHLVTTP